MSDESSAQQRFQYAHSYTYSSGQVIEPIAILKVDDDHPFPKSQDPNLVQIAEIASIVVELLGSVTVKLTNLLGVGAVPEVVEDDDQGPMKKLLTLAGRIVEGIEKAGQVGSSVDEVARFLAKIAEHQEALHEIARLAHVSHTKGTGQSGRDLWDRLLGVLGELAKLVGEAVVVEILTLAGLWGRPGAIADYAEQFQTFTVPNVASSWSSDAQFARMRIAGPNPVLIARLDALLANFPVDPARYATAMDGDDLDTALSDGRVYLCDYQALAPLVGGTCPDAQKYITPALALFALPPGAGPLKPVAIQCGQTPGHSTPVLYPDDGEAWELAKLHVQVADANYHELISHLGRTHLVVEPFAVSTLRMLSDDHPVRVLLMPHFQGTLFINNAAITTLVAPNGIIDRILAGTIESSWIVASAAYTGLDFDAARLPEDLKARGVDDPERFPDYPYRDDALLVWKAIEGWVEDYASVYYNDDAAVRADAELQAWIGDLVSPQAAGLSGLGQTEDGTTGLFTFDYLVQVLTMVIYTASAQHAAVNFPQRTEMAYSPAMPLAAYAPPPLRTSGPASERETLDTLPPLEAALLGLATLTGLGGVYFTRLGEYDRHQGLKAPQYFSNPRVQQALEAFQGELARIERQIGERNLARPTYEHLLPSRIPQSINI